jgi:hypothetical protein
MLQAKTSQTRQRLLFHGFIRLWLRNSGLCPSNSLATTANFISWNDAIAADGLLMSLSACIILNRKIPVLLCKDEHDIIKKIPAASILGNLFCIYNKRHLNIIFLGGFYYAD